MNVALPTLLLVEDDPNDVMLFRRAMDKSKMANPLQLAKDGEEAVAYLSGEGLYADRNTYPLPAIMLLDLKLPRKSGLEVLEWLRDQPGINRLPVVVMTSSKESTDVGRAYDLGANSYLVKPVSFETLLEMVKVLGLYWFILNEKPDISLRTME
ncbi:response regulator [Sulfurirhabdus autotrophica]|uniref:Response regulator receiver domain-containing protein n=1 Tax=Sulfurirhabdus autotrophica TaxID=1706046 RepID=A0A4R3Y8Z9_9PROT|nr:response regulator [Sulfurirhabdus autotrophica]TCV87438.1 response regulator receiver domain-containing protein [Sulfurirhabdus autotrophica]